MFWIKWDYYEKMTSSVERKNKYLKNKNVSETGPWNIYFWDGEGMYDMKLYFFFKEMKNLESWPAG